MTLSKQKIVFISIFCFIAGVLFYGFYDEKIHIDYSLGHKKEMPTVPCKRSLTLSYALKDSIYTLTHQYYPTSNDENDGKNIVNLWLSYVRDYYPRLNVALCNSFIIKNGIWYCSFTLNPFNAKTCMYEKHNFLHGLLNTLQDFYQKPSMCQFLVNHEVLQDDDYDFSLPWSLEFFK